MREMPNYGLYKLACSNAEMLVEKTLLGWSVRTNFDITTRVNIPALVETVIRRCKIDRAKLNCPRPPSGSAEVCRAMARVGQTGAYGAVEMLLAAEWTRAYQDMAEPVQGY